MGQTPRCHPPSTHHTHTPHTHIHPSPLPPTLHYTTPTTWYPTHSPPPPLPSSCLLLTMEQALLYLDDSATLKQAGSPFSLLFTCPLPTSSSRNIKRRELTTGPRHFLLLWSSHSLYYHSFIPSTSSDPSPELILPPCCNINTRDLQSSLGANQQLAPPLPTNHSTSSRCSPGYLRPLLCWPWPPLLPLRPSVLVIL